jgi:predicted transcriptional regulator
MADPKMTSVNIPRTLHRKLKTLRKKTRLAVGVMAELAIEEYVRLAAKQAEKPL